MGYIIAEGGSGWIDEVQLVIVTECDGSSHLTYVVGCSAPAEGLG